MADTPRRLLYRAPRQAQDPFGYYYGFLEARDAPVAPPTLTAELRVPAAFDWPDGGVSRMGLSVVGAAAFRMNRGKIAAAPSAPGPEWRSERRRQLGEFFKQTPAERLEIYPSLDQVRAPRLQTAFRMGAWFIIGLRKLIDPQDPVVCIHSDRDGERRALMSVRYLARVSTRERDWLREVFSLSHIGDLGDEGPDGVPTPITPLTPMRVAIDEKARPRKDEAVVFGLDRLPQWPNAAGGEQNDGPITRVEKSPQRPGRLRGGS